MTTTIKPQQRDEWELDLLDLDAYLARIGYDRAVPLRADLATLTALHRAHATTVPFENLDVVLRQGIRVDLAGVQEKLVRQRRGGYCFEMNTLFAAVLERVGFQVERLIARTGPDPEREPRSRTHLVLSVRAEGLRWLADVGFGSGLIEPLPFAPGPTPVSQGAWTFLLEQSPPPAWPGTLRLRERQGDEWVTLYSFTEEPQRAIDIELANHYTATHPRSAFLRRSVAMQRGVNGARELIGRRFSVLRPGRETEQRDLGDAELRTLLRAEFGLELTDEQFTALVAAIPDPD